jgi:hypothetical protein
MPARLRNSDSSAVGGVQVGRVGIGGIGPDCFIDNLGRFFRVHVKSGFHAVGLLTDFAVAAMANRGRFGGSAVLVFENAAKRGGGVDLSVRSESLRLEFFQQTFAFAVDAAPVAGCDASRDRRPPVRWARPVPATCRWGRHACPPDSRRGNASKAVHSQPIWLPAPPQTWVPTLRHRQLWGGSYSRVDGLFPGLLGTSGFHIDDSSNDCLE